ncbi:MAG: hypothetical protein ABI165_13295 [Bryobacteraceae bacterium]
MPTFKFTDTLSNPIDSVSSNPNPLASLVKYVRNPTLGMVLLPELVNALPQPLIGVAATPLRTGLSFSGNVGLGVHITELTVGAGPSQAVTLHAKPGSDLFDRDPFGSPVAVQSGEGYLSLALSAAVNPGLSRGAGQLSFGVDASGSLTVEFFRKFALADQPTVAQALGDVIDNFIIPADVADLEALAPGDISVVSGSGSLRVSASMTASIAPNPLATPNLPFIDRPIAAQAGASVKLAGNFQISGSYKIRVRKIAAGVVELGYYRARGAQWTVAAAASAGVGVDFGKTDLLCKLLGEISGTPQADVAQLVNVGLTGGEIERIQDAIGKSVDHSLQASLEFALSGGSDTEAAFLYEIQLAALDVPGRNAVVLALGADLSALAAFEAAALEADVDGHGVIAPGITMLRSAMSDTRKRGASLKVNLVGLLNFQSWSDLIARSEFIYEPVTGELTVNQTVKGDRIGVLTLPQAQEKLRKLMFDSVLTTTAYRASGALGTMQLSSAAVHFAFNHSTNAHTISDYLDGVAAVNLITPAAKAALMLAFTGAGASFQMLRVEFNDAASESMFLHAGAPRPQADFEFIARTALAMLLLPGDSDDTAKYRRDVLGGDALWNRLKAVGQPGFRQELPALNDVQLAVVQSDYTNVMWWAESMATTAVKLAQMKKFIASVPADTLHNNPEFIDRYNDLQKHMADVVAKSGLSFGLPFGLVSLFRAAAGAVPSAAIVSPALTRFFLPAQGAPV